jgi:hypothetical protein
VRIGSVGGMGCGLGIVVAADAGGAAPGVLLGLCAVGLCGVTPVVPIGPPAGLCCPAAVAGLGDEVVGGVPCANAAPAAAAKTAAAQAVFIALWM